MKSMLKLYLTLIGGIVTLNASAQVSSISSENLVQYGKEQAFWAADVSCDDGSIRTIQRKTDESQWCGKAVEGFCDSTKESAAVKICGTQYTATLSLLETAQQAQSNAEEAEQRARQAERERAEQSRLSDQLKQQEAAKAPLKKQISIKEELLKIEQEKLDLRRQELELQRRAVEIESLLKESS